jgi:hypothetical protein
MWQFFHRSSYSAHLPGVQANFPAEPELSGCVFGVCYEGKGLAMKTKSEKAVDQPKPFTPGVTKAMVRQHAYEMFRDKLPERPLTLEDWVLAEKDLVASLDAENLPK